MENEGGNLDTSKIFAYTRYTKNQKLLFVVNFDFRETHTFRLNIGEHALQTMNCPLDGTLVIKEVLEKDFVDEFPMQEVLERGIPISILPNTCLIFELQWK